MKKAKLKKPGKFSRFCSKFLVCIVLMLGLLIVLKGNPTLKKNVYDKTMSLLQEKTKDCRSPAVKALNEAQTAYDMKIRKIMTEDMPRYMSGNDRQEAKVEAKALYAEYSIDFAVQAAQSALLAVLSALDEQMNFEEWRKENE